MRYSSEVPPHQPWQTMSLWNSLYAQLHCHDATGLDPLIPVKTYSKQIHYRQLCGFKFVPTVWESSTYGFEGQMFIYFGPYNVFLCHFAQIYLWFILNEVSKHFTDRKQIFLHFVCLPEYSHTFLIQEKSICLKRILLKKTEKIWHCCVSVYLNDIKCELKHNAAVNFLYLLHTWLVMLGLFDRVQLYDPWQLVPLRAKHIWHCLSEPVINNTGNINLGHQEER